MLETLLDQTPRRSDNQVNNRIALPELDARTVLL
jgi:hypothetical protein